MKQNKKFDISRDGLIVKLSVSKFNGDVHSKAVEQAAARSEDAEEASVIGKVRLLTRVQLAKVNAIAGEAKDIWRGTTRVWEEGARRYCPVSAYPKLRERLDDCARRFTDVVTEAIANQYETLKADSEKRLKALGAGLFPSKDELMAKYGMQIITDVIASNDDVRFSNGLTQAQVDALIADREARLLAQVEEGDKALVEQIAEAVTHLIERLDAIDGKKRSQRKSTILRDKETGKYPIIENIQAMTDVAERLNITANPKVASVIESVRKNLSRIDAEQLKDDKLARSEVKAKARTVLDELASF